MSETAILLCGHGSRDPETAAEFERTAGALRGRMSPHGFATGYLEFARPTIQQGLAQLAAAGARRILAIPAMLFAAGHVKNDLPREIKSFIAGNPSVEVRLGRDLSIDEKLLTASADRIAAAAPAPRDDALLVVVGRGTSNPEVNAKVATIARVLRERMGFAAAECAFSGVAHPRVDAALESAARRGFRRIVVFPYFLFTGVLVKRVYAHAGAVAACFPEIEFIKAGHLCDHPLVVDALAERVSELLGRDEYGQS